MRTPDEIEAQLGEDLRALRLLKNVTQADLAERAGVSVRALKNLESGAGSTLRTLVRVSRALGRAGWFEMVAPVPSIDPLTMPRTGPYRQRARPRKDSAR